jgi:hypothetical protein
MLHRMDPSEVTRAEKWLVVASCAPLFFAGLLFLFA